MVHAQNRLCPASVWFSRWLADDYAPPRATPYRATGSVEREGALVAAYTAGTGVASDISSSRAAAVRAASRNGAATTCATGSGAPSPMACLGLCLASRLRPFTECLGWLTRGTPTSR